MVDGLSVVMLMNQRMWIEQYIADEYGVAPVCLWQKFPNHAVFRHQNAKQKWFALVGRIDGRKLGLDRVGQTDFVNLKCYPEHVIFLRQAGLALPAYHMNKEHWLTIVLDNGFEQEELATLIDLSHDLTIK